MGVHLTDTALTLRRVWFGLSSAALTTITHATGPTASATSFVALGYDTSISTAWRCCTGDGTNYSCADITGTTIVANTEYTLTVDYSVAGTLTCAVQEGSNAAVSIAKTTNLVVSTATGLGVFNGTTTLSAAILNHNTAKLSLEQN